MFKNNVFLVSFRFCYNKFSKNLKSLSSGSENDGKNNTKKSSRRKNTDVEKTKFHTTCIFCDSKWNKKVKQRGSWSTESLISFEEDSWKSIVKKAESNNDEDFLVRVRGYDLQTYGAVYHSSCRSKYMSCSTRWLSSNVEQITAQEGIEHAHQNAFERVSSILNDEVIDKKKVLKLSELTSIYRRALEGTEFQNDQYRGENLKKKIENDFSFKNKISFVRLNESSKYESYLVYSMNTEYSQVIKSAYYLGNSDNIKDVAKHLRKHICEAFERVKDMPWPPSVEDLNSMNDIPEDFERFLSTLMFDKTENLSQKDTRLLYSLGQDICRAVSNFKWKFPKHVLLCMTLRHMFRSKEFATLLNRMGHCESY